MYIPRHHEETDRAVLHALVAAHPLGTWVTQGGDGLVADHIPFLLDADRGEHGTLVAHVARANPVWRSLGGAAGSLVVFQGAETYITPSWYPSRHAGGKVVPTWNYAVVHAHGRARAIDDRDWLLANVTRLTEAHEAGRAAPWRVSDAPAAFVESLLAAIVGIEIPISRLVGKWKVSQNRPEVDRRGVVEGLQDSGAAQAAEMAGMVGRFLPSPQAD